MIFLDNRSTNMWKDGYMHAAIMKGGIASFWAAPSINDKVRIYDTKPHRLGYVHLGYFRLD